VFSSLLNYLILVFIVDCCEVENYSGQQGPTERYKKEPCINNPLSKHKQRTETLSQTPKNQNFPKIENIH